MSTKPVQQQIPFPSSVAEIQTMRQSLGAARQENAELRALLTKYMAENTKLVADLRRADQKLFAAHGERAKAQRRAL